MDKNDMPDSVVALSGLFEKAMRNLVEINQSFRSALETYIESEQSSDEGERILGRKTLFFHLTTMRQIDREFKKVLPTKLVDEIYESMCEEFGAGHIEQEIIEAVEKGEWVSHIRDMREINMGLHEDKLFALKELRDHIETLEGEVKCRVARAVNVLEYLIYNPIQEV